MSVLIVFSTFPDAASANRAATSLVEARLAACINMLPGMTSIYRWQGKTEQANEVLLIVKTTQAAYPQLESALKACHPYELPEIIAVATEVGLPDYLNWVSEETHLPRHKKT